MKMSLISIVALAGFLSACSNTPMKSNFRNPAGGVGDVGSVGVGAAFSETSQCGLAGGGLGGLQLRVDVANSKYDGYHHEIYLQKGETLETLAESDKEPSGNDLGKMFSFKIDGKKATLQMAAQNAYILDPLDKHWSQQLRNAVLTVEGEKEKTMICMVGPNKG